MDFRVRQDRGTTFAYTLPISETKALVEYTLFTTDLLKKEQYDLELKSYIDNVLKIEQYKIIDDEFGVIPMTNAKFPFYENGMYHIGTAGGQTKASSGYTFQFIQKQSQRITDYMIEERSLKSIPDDAKRFHFYDTVLLRLLAEKKLGGDEIFSRLFQRNKASAVFKFLDNETSIAEELKLISTLPTLPFLKAAVKK
jgi:lycopene beta-cyclase